METHVKILAVLFLVWAGLCVPLGLTALFLFPFFGSVIALFCFFVAGLVLIVGVGLLGRWPWARVCGIVMSGVNLAYVPVGTALGVYGLWVLLNRDTEHLFRTARTDTDRHRMIWYVSILVGGGAVLFLPLAFWLLSSGDPITLFPFLDKKYGPISREVTHSDSFAVLKKKAELQRKSGGIRTAGPTRLEEFIRNAKPVELRAHDTGQIVTTHLFTDFEHIDRGHNDPRTPRVTTRDGKEAQIAVTNEGQRVEVTEEAWKQLGENDLDFAYFLNGRPARSSIPPPSRSQYMYLNAETRLNLYPSSDPTGQANDEFRALAQQLNKRDSRVVARAGTRLKIIERIGDEYKVTGDDSRTVWYVDAKFLTDKPPPSGSALRRTR